MQKNDTSDVSQDQLVFYTVVIDLHIATQRDGEEAQLGVKVIYVGLFKGLKITIRNAKMGVFTFIEYSIVRGCHFHFPGAFFFIYNGAHDG